MWLLGNVKLHYVTATFLMVLVYTFDPATWLERNYVRESFHSLPRKPNDKEVAPEPLTYYISYIF